MNKSELQEALEMFAEDCVDDISVHSYSGRGMNGEKCLAITVSGHYMGLGSLIAFLIEYGANTCDDVTDMVDSVKEMCSDNMGRGMVYYFPGTSFVDENDDEYSDEND